MNARPDTENSHLLEIAEAISEGVPVDWARVVPDSNATTTAVIDELRVIEHVSKLSDAIPTTWGPFTITAEIGHGSYGHVYRAFDGNMNHEVALKVIRPRGLEAHADPSKALNEARLLVQVNHPNVVRVFRADRIGMEVGVAMEFVHGHTLETLVRQQGPFGATETTLIGVDICRALAAVHAARLVHGDVKAQNVMRASGGRTVLMDFGAGYDVKTNEAAGQRFAGTPLYLAPEIFAGATRSQVTDIYSVGVLLYHLATGSYPVEGRTGAEVSHRHERGAPRRLLRDVRPDLPDGFIRVVEQAIAVRPEERYQTAGALEAALNVTLRGEALKPVPPAGRATHWRTALLAAAVVVLAMGIGAGYLRRNLPAGPPEAAATPPAMSVASVVPDVTSVAAGDAYRIEAAFYRDGGGSEVRLESGARVAPGDQLSLRVTSSVPTYVYVVNEDDHGEAYLLFPLPGQPRANPLPAGTRHEIPGVINGERTFWKVSSAGGREHFVIFASPQPLSPAFERVFAALPRPSADAPVLAQPLSFDMARELRGVGGLTKAPVARQSAKIHDEFGAPLPAGEETARGVWVRQFTLDNPRR